ncbi:MAG: ExeA family protein [Nevskiaceae bacterium]
MYEAHFGFRQAPFGLTPDTRFYYSSPSHQEALNTLLVALRSGEGFLKITGEIGLGKTLLCRQLLNALGQEFVTAYVPNPAVTPRALFQTVADELGCPNEGHRPDELLKAISHRLLENAGKGLRTVLVIDEAQALTDHTLEAVRLLTNLETETYKLLQVVLFGQPELDERLARPELRQLRQRITFTYRLRPLSREQLNSYVRHRLEVAGSKDPTLFGEDALRILYRASRGIPRLANILGHKALLAAFGPGHPRVNRSDALAAVGDTDSATLPTGAKLWLLAQENLGLVCLALVLSLGLAYVFSSGFTVWLPGVAP